MSHWCTSPVPSAGLLVLLALALAVRLVALAAFGYTPVFDAVD